MTKPESVPRTYKEREILTAPPERVVMLLYQGLETYINQAMVCLDQSEFTRASERLGRAQAVVWELLGSLDRDQGQDVAVNLARLYRFMIDRLVDANLTKDRKPLEEVMRILAELREGWDAILKPNRTPGR